jgi:hypothetical protein
MKNTWNMTAWAVAVALMAALIMTGCGGDDDDDNGETLTISGKQVYTVMGSDGGFEYTPYSGKVLNVFTGYWDTQDHKVIIQDAVGTISGSGILNMTINGAPANTRPITEFFDSSAYKNFTISARDTKGFRLNLFIIYGEDEEALSKQKLEDGLNEIITYIYVNHDVHITGQGTSYSVWEGYEEATSNIDLQFKKGWNALHWKEDQTREVTNISFSVGDSSDIKWCFWARRG